MISGLSVDGNEEPVRDVVMKYPSTIGRMGSALPAAGLMEAASFTRVTWAERIVEIGRALRQFISELAHGTFL
jgi:hypothetical protein